MLPKRCMREGPEEGGGGPKEDSTSEDSKTYRAVLLASASLWRCPAKRGSLWCA